MAELEYKNQKINSFEDKLNKLMEMIKLVTLEFRLLLRYVTIKNFTFI
jgi:hypothetical protein